MSWSAWRLLLFPARPALTSLGLAGVGGLDAGLLVDRVVGADDSASFFGGDGAPVGVAQYVVLAGAPARRDSGEQDGGMWQIAESWCRSVFMSRLYFAAS